jgi:voltage-gated potassium channel
MSNSARKILSHNNLGTTLMVSFLVVVFAGTIMATVDPGIETPLDGIWWAWVTVTTVGYGDIVPVTTIGRIFAGFLILLGIALFSMLTASFSAFFLSESENKLTAKEIENSQKLEKLQEKISSLEGKIDELLAKK